MTTFNFKGFGTAQIPDLLIYKGDTLYIYSNPLERYPNIDSLRDRLFGNKEGCLTTACWREYQAEWTVINDQLFLTNIYSCCYKDDHVKSNLKELFGDHFIDGKVEANWVTGNLLVSQGKFLFYVYSDYYNVHEGQNELIFKNGKQVATKNYDNSKSRQSEYSKDNEKLFSHVYSQIQWEKLPYEDKKVKIFVEFSANEQGLIDSVKVLKGYDNQFNEEAIRVIKTIPEWDIIYIKGEHQRRAWIFPVLFSEENRLKYKKD